MNLSICLKRIRLLQIFIVIYFLNTVEGEKALQYLEKRGFTRESIEKYGIGWSLDDSERSIRSTQTKKF